MPIKKDSSCQTSSPILLAWIPSVDILFFFKSINRYVIISENTIPIRLKPSRPTRSAFDPNMTIFKTSKCHTTSCQLSFFNRTVRICNSLPLNSLTLNCLSIILRTFSWNTITSLPTKQMMRIICEHGKLSAPRAMSRDVWTNQLTVVTDLKKFSFKELLGPQLLACKLGDPANRFFSRFCSFFSL